MASLDRHADARLLSSATTSRFIAFSVIFLAAFAGFRHHPIPHHSTSSSFSLLQIFFYLNSLAFFSSLCGLLVSAFHFISCAGPVQPAAFGSVEFLASAQRKRLTAALSKSAFGVLLLTLASVFLAMAFPFAGLVAAGDSKCLQSAVLIPSIIGGLVMLQLLLWMPRQVFLAS